MIFHVSRGLRGCYMPDSSYVATFSTRRELKATVETEAETYRDAGAAGLSRKAIAQFVAEAWRMAKRHKLDGLPLALPIKPAGACGYSSGIFLSRASRDDLREYRKHDHD